MKRWSAGEENERVHDHFARVLALLTSTRAFGEPRLTAGQRVNRSALLEELTRYRARRRFPGNHRHPTPTPAFIDELDGARCAVAHLLEATGEHALVQHVATTANHARVRDLATNDAFRSWLFRNGLSLCEAAIIQPVYCEAASACVCYLESADVVLEGTVLDQTHLRVEAVLSATAEIAVGDVLVNEDRPLFYGPEQHEGQRWIAAASMNMTDSSLYLVFPMLDASTVDTGVCAARVHDAPVTLTRRTLADLLAKPDPIHSCEASLMRENVSWSIQEGVDCEALDPPIAEPGCATSTGPQGRLWAAALVAAALALGRAGQTRRRQR